MGMKWVGSQHQHWSLSQLLPLDVKEKEGLEEEEEEEEEEEVEGAFGGGAHIVVEEADRGDGGQIEEAARRSLWSYSARASTSERRV